MEIPTIVMKLTTYKSWIYGAELFGIMAEVQKKGHTTLRVIKVPLDVPKSPNKALLNVCAWAPKGLRTRVRSARHLAASGATSHLSATSGNEASVVISLIWCIFFPPHVSGNKYLIMHARSLARV